VTVATYAAAKLLGVLPRARITRAVGRLADAKLHPLLAQAVIGLYVRAYRVDLDESVPPEGAFASFDAFFTRALREGRRPACADERAVVSPADGLVHCSGDVHAGGHLVVKGRDYKLSELIGDEDDVARYEGGQFAVVYLSPRDYHRVHSPVAGVIPLVRSMPGDLFPVNSIGERHVPRLFSTNRRVAIVIDTQSSGRVTVVMVGAMIVGRITVSVIEERDVPLGLHVINPPRPVARGDEIGMFHLGSTAVVFIEKGVSPPWADGPRPIRVGEPLGPLEQLRREHRAEGRNGYRPRTGEPPR
jgi:phosphatidylserine decarboxylase